MRFPKFKLKTGIALFMTLAVLFTFVPFAVSAEEVEEAGETTETAEVTEIIEEETAQEESGEQEDVGFLRKFVLSLGIINITGGEIIMILIAFVLFFLAIVKRYEPMLMLPLAFGILIANMPLANLSAYDSGGLLNFLYQGLRGVIYPPLIFLCIGTMTDFAPLIASPRNALIGIGGQLGIFVAFGLALLIGQIGTAFGIESLTFTLKEAASIGIIGSSDGPTSIFTATRLAPELLASVAIAAFSYMALVPFIQPPIMKMLTNDKERVIVMPEPKKVTKRQKILFPIIMTVVVLLLVPSAAALIGMLMLGNLIRECGVVERYVRTLQNDILNILTLLVAMSIGSSATAEYFLTAKTLIIIALGLLAFVFGTVGGVLTAKIMCKVTGGKINPLIGNAGVSAMPMAARISQKMGQKYNPQNHLLMHAMGPLVSSTIGSAVVAGLFIAFFA